MWRAPSTTVYTTPRLPAQHTLSAAATATSLVTSTQVRVRAEPCSSLATTWSAGNLTSIKANHIATTDQLADILTKSLGKAKFQEMRERIGLKQITPKADHNAYGEK